jgi:hypothetical protein
MSDAAAVWQRCRSTGWCHPRTQTRTARRPAHSGHSGRGHGGPCAALGPDRVSAHESVIHPPKTRWDRPSSWPVAISCTCRWQSAPPATKRSLVGCRDAERIRVPTLTSLSTSRLGRSTSRTRGHSRQEYAGCARRSATYEVASRKMTPLPPAHVSTLRARENSTDETGSETTTSRTWSSVRRSHTLPCAHAHTRRQKDGRCARVAPRGAGTYRSRRSSPDVTRRCGSAHAAMARMGTFAAVLNTLGAGPWLPTVSLRSPPKKPRHAPPPPWSYAHGNW